MWPVYQASFFFLLAVYYYINILEVAVMFFLSRSVIILIQILKFLEMKIRGYQLRT